MILMRSSFTARVRRPEGMGEREREREPLMIMILLIPIRTRNTEIRQRQRQQQAVADRLMDGHRNGSERKFVPTRTLILDFLLWTK